MNSPREFKTIDKKTPHIPKVETAHAILLVSGNYVLQLRDDIPTIAAPGQWSLFGGVIKTKESPLKAVKREIKEELSIESKEFTFLWAADYYCDFIGDMVRTWLFLSDITKLWPRHILKEGKDVVIFEYDRLRNLNMPDEIRAMVDKFKQNKIR